MTVAGFGVGYILIYFICIIFILPISLIFSFFVKDFRISILRYSSFFAIFFIPVLWQGFKESFLNNLWGNSQIVGALWLFFSLASLFVLIFSFLIRGWAVWYFFCFFVFLNFLLSIYFLI
jgi:hypothetical protein